jgi:hypothetical protein
VVLLSASAGGDTDMVILSNQKHMVDGNRLNAYQMEEDRISSNMREGNMDFDQYVDVSSFQP